MTVNNEVRRALEESANFFRDMLQGDSHWMDLQGQAESTLERVNSALADCAKEDNPGATVTRCYFGSYAKPGLTYLTVEDIMDENQDGDEKFAWSLLNEIVAEGTYNDSDWSSRTFCYYITKGDVEDVAEQAEEWWNDNPEIVNEYELENPREW